MPKCWKWTDAARVIRNVRPPFCYSLILLFIYLLMCFFRICISLSFLLLRSFFLFFSLLFEILSVAYDDCWFWPRLPWLSDWEIAEENLAALSCVNIEWAGSTAGSGLRSFWHHFGITIGSISGQFGIIFESFLGIIFESFLRHFWVIFESIFKHSWASF